MRRACAVLTHYHNVKRRMDVAANTSGEAGAAYRVLARKYRPKVFEDLIGQDAVVRTLKNAFATGRIAQAYMLTGVRGVGKTTTARLIARALNYVGPEGDAGPTMDMAETASIARRSSNPAMSM